MMYSVIRKSALACTVAAFLALSAATPQLSPESLFGKLQNRYTALVYSFVWVPLMEMSVLIAEHVILPFAIRTSSQHDEQNTGAQHKPDTALVYSLNLPVFEQIPIRKTGTTPNTVAFGAMNAPDTSRNRPVHWPAAAAAGLPLISLALLFIKILPRNDIPPALLCANPA